MEIDVLTHILRRFVAYLELIPYNLRLFVHSTLFFLLTIDIALTIFHNLGNENFSYINWGKNKILKVGFILFIINRYEWFLAGVKNFFFYAVEKGLRVNLADAEYFEDPSSIYGQGVDLAYKIWEEGVSARPSTWIYLVFCVLIIIGFLTFAVQVILCWVEFYFLTGFSFIFLPFGVLDIGASFYKNVFLTITGATIKLAVLNFWIILSNVILRDLFKIAEKTKISFDKVSIIFGTTYVLVAVMKFIPSLTSGLLSARPELNANQAAASAKTATTDLLKDAQNTAKSIYSGAINGAKTGSNIGATTGTIIGGPAGAAIGKVVGGAVGTVGAVVGGSYAGAKYFATKETTTNGGNTKEKKEENSAKHSNVNSDIKNTTSESKYTSSQSPQTTSTTSNVSNQSNSGTSYETGSSKIESSRKTKNNLPEWAKEDY